MVSFEELDLFDIKNTVSYEVPKYVEKRGYIYLVKNINYPELFKLGKTTNMATRLTSYNSGQPRAVTKLLCISELLSDVGYVEKRLLDWLKQEVEPIQYRKEWFDVKYMATIKEFIIEAESIYKV